MDIDHDAGRDQIGPGGCDGVFVLDIGDLAAVGAGQGVGRIVGEREDAVSYFDHAVAGIFGDTDHAEAGRVGRGDGFAFGVEGDEVPGDDRASGSDFILFKRAGSIESQHHSFSWFWQCFLISANCSSVRPILAAICFSSSVSAAAAFSGSSSGFGI